ncbi:MAG: hypothetical protein LH628_07460 [Microcoleus sp. CAN_BIN18]|nr:hypothetical protein [Microcoleus sp. CAN_BIN18]
MTHQRQLSTLRVPWTLWLLSSLLARILRVFESKALVDIAQKLALLANSI